MIGTKLSLIGKGLEQMRDARRIAYLAAALGMLLYAVPRLEIGGGWTMATSFSIVWIGFSLLIIASQLHFILGVDKETKQELDRIKRVKRLRLEQALTGQTASIRSKK
jgi:hypothetical protein